MSEQFENINAESNRGQSEYTINLNALLRMGIYLTRELERLGSKASSNAQHAVDIIELELGDAD
jgi:hypothetical protein